MKCWLRAVLLSCILANIFTLLALLLFNLENKGLPLCTEGVLDKRSFDYSNQDYIWTMKPTEEGYCKLQTYGKSETLNCLDNLMNIVNGDLHFAFVGDSRIRQLFYEFLKLIPRHDSDLPIAYHQDMAANILLQTNLTVSFYWQPILNETTISLIRELAKSTAPHFVLLGISSHHMILKNGIGHKPFEQNLKNMLPELEQLSSRMKERSNGKIVWLNQYPSLDYKFQKLESPIYGIITEKIDHYNSIARNILKNNSIVRVWDSASPMMEDYVRSCFVNRRKTKGIFTNTWVDCMDLVHPGNIVLGQVTQLMLNDICNSIYSPFQMQ